MGILRVRQKHVSLILKGLHRLDNSKYRQGEIRGNEKEGLINRIFVRTNSMSRRQKNIKKERKQKQIYLIKMC